MSQPAKKSNSTEKKFEAYASKVFQNVSKTTDLLIEAFEEEPEKDAQKSQKPALTTP
jgi:hypothetical protein